MQLMEPAPVARICLLTRRAEYILFRTCQSLSRHHDDHVEPYYCQQCERSQHTMCTHHDRMAGSFIQPHHLIMKLNHVKFSKIVKITSQDSPQYPFHHRARVAWPGRVNFRNNRPVGSSCIDGLSRVSLPYCMNQGVGRQAWEVLVASPKVPFPFYKFALFLGFDMGLGPLLPCFPFRRW